MAIGFSLFMIALGAIIAYAVDLGQSRWLSRRPWVRHSGPRYTMKW